jgi:Flp pilus assembly protein TadD
LHLAILETDHMRDYAAARERLKEGVQLEPWNYEMHGMLALALCNLNQFSEAIPVLQRCLEINPEDCIALYNLGVARTQTGDPHGAVEAYRRLLEVAPGKAATQPGVVGLMTTARRELDRLRLDTD